MSRQIVLDLRHCERIGIEPGKLLEEAADRIEALESALRNCCDKWENGNGICEWLEAVDEARAALGEKSND